MPPERFNVDELRKQLELESMPVDYDELCERVPCSHRRSRGEHADADGRTGMLTRLRRESMAPEREIRRAGAR